MNEKQNRIIVSVAAKNVLVFFCFVLCFFIYIFFLLFEEIPWARTKLTYRRLSSRIMI